MHFLTFLLGSRLAAPAASGRISSYNFIHKMNQGHLGAASHGWWCNNLRSRIRVTHRIIERTRTHNHVYFTTTRTDKGQGKAVGAPGSRPVEVLSINVIVRAVTGALEALAVQAVGVGTAEVHATLVQRNPERALPLPANSLPTPLL